MMNNNQKNRFILISFSIIFIIFLAFITFAIVSTKYILLGFSPVDPNSTETKIFTIQKGEGVREISTNLEAQGLISSGLLFKLHILLRGAAGRLKAGTYEFSPSMSMDEIVEKLVKGDVLKEKITIIEGWNLRDIAWHLEGKGMFQAEELFELVGFPLVDYRKTKELPQPKDFSQEFDFLKDKPEYVGLEGYLFPDTYEINPVRNNISNGVNKGANLEEIIRKILANFDKKLTPELREKISTQGKSIFEIINIASLIEKEVQTLEDKKIVSGILWKRLKIGMPLQIDATITYITGKKTTRISIEETKIDSPYNTYKYKGLPLGPISNPGLESIEAAIYPKDSDFWYYLSAPEGETIFSKTLEEHNLAKAKHLKE